METRLAVMQDALALARLHAESFGSEAWSEKQIADSFALPTTRVWVAGDPASGFIMMQQTADEAEVLTFCTSLPMRRRGIGESLLQSAINTLCVAGVRRIFLEVAADNAAAQALYLKNGFARIGKRSGYYRRGDRSIDAVMLSRAL